VCIVADYDCDGATACAVAVRGLRAMGLSRTSFIVPDRRHDGYGLTPALAQRVHDTGASLLVTVDNGIASVEGVRRARQLGLRVLVTDHHLPGPELPDADALVNPNQAGCDFDSKHLAGVGVMFYVLLATRSWLRQQGHFADQAEPRLDTLLPLVALGTVADVVPLDANNRRLVHLGLERIRRGAMPAGMRALLEVSGRAASWAQSQDLGFALGPRINAAGRLANMGLGIECLLSDDPVQALAHAQALDEINRDRRQIEDEMREQALSLMGHLPARAPTSSALCLFDPGFHEGVIGILAGRLKDQYHRPTIVFAPAHGDSGLLKGSGRSIPGFHLRDALDALTKQHPQWITQFGGHAMAAGCTLRAAHLAEFERALAALAQSWLAPEDLSLTRVSDGELSADDWSASSFKSMEEQVWGAGFAAPQFHAPWHVVSQRLVGSKHLKLKLSLGRTEVDGIWFGRTEPLPERATLLYRPQINRWQGRESLQIQIEASA
jgi:single-stranded-DNA-specific exonuclease